MNQIPAYLASLFSPIPQQYQQGGGSMSPGFMSLLAYLLAGQGDQPQEQAQQPERPFTNPYLGNPFRPSLPGLSPTGRYNDMVLRKSAEIADRASEGKAAVAEAGERQRLVDSITHPPPASPYGISLTRGPTGQPGWVLSAPRYGSGSVSFAPPGTEVHGKFGPEGMQFGQIGGKDEAQPTGSDPLQTTYQQQMIMDAIHKTLGKKK